MNDKRLKEKRVKEKLGYYNFKSTLLLFILDCLVRIDGTNGKIIF